MRALRLIAVWLAVLAPAVAGAPPAVATTPPVPFGAHASTRYGQTKVQAFTALERELGRRLDMIRVFEQWNSGWSPGDVGTVEGWTRARGSIPVVSVKTRRSDGTPVSWSDIANAQPGDPLYAQIVTWADRMKAWPGTVFFCLNHEASNWKSERNGTSSEYIQAWRTFHDVFAARGVTNVRWTWIIGDPLPWEVPVSDRRYAPSWYPGNRYVDVLAVDVYNWNCSGSRGRSFESLTEKFLAFAADHPKKSTMVAEYGTNEVDADSGGKAGWITRAAEAAKAWPGLVGFMAFHSQYGISCRWWLDTSAESLDAARAVGAQPFYGGSG